MTRQFATLLVMAALVLAQAAPTAAQSGPTYNWEVEVHVGGTFGSTPSAGTGSLAGPDGLSSWAFGPGSAFFNQFGAVGSARIVPLDPVLTSAIMRQRPGGSLGMRLTRALGSRVSLEGSFTFGYRRGEVTATVRDALEATRASYAAALEALFAARPGNFADPRIAVTTAIADERGYEVIGVGALNIRIADGGLQPHVTLGIGVTTGLGDFPSFTLASDYEFLFNGIPTHQRDNVTVRGKVGIGPLGVVGGGLRKDLTSRIGVRADARLYVGGSAVTTRLTSASSSVSGPGTPTIPPFGAPFVPTITGSASVTSFKSGGSRAIGTVTVGFFVRM